MERGRDREREYTVLGWRMEKCQNLIVFSDEWIWMWCTHEQMWWYANSNTHTHTQHTYLAWRHEEWCGEFEAEGVAVAKWIWSEFSTFISNIGRAAASGLRGYSNFVCFNWTFYLSVENNNTFYLLIWLKSWNLQIFCCLIMGRRIFFCSAIQINNCCLNLNALRRISEYQHC